jgi:hypothetical protein
MISKTKERNRPQQIGIGRSVAISTAVLFLAVWKNMSVTHFPTLFLNAYGRSQFELVLLYMANVCVGYRLNLAVGESSSARSLNCEGLTRVSPTCCGNSRSDVFRLSKCFIPCLLAVETVVVMCFAPPNVLFHNSSLMSVKITEYHRVI